MADNTPEVSQEEIAAARQEVVDALQTLVEMTTGMNVIVTDFLGAVEIVLPESNAIAMRLEWSATMTPWKGYGMADAAASLAQRLFTG